MAERTDLSKKSDWNWVKTAALPLVSNNFLNCFNLCCFLLFREELLFCSQKTKAANSISRRQSRIGRK